jgi:hypothetical protein
MELVQTLVDLAKVMPGLILFITVLVNILKHFGVVKDGEKFANTVQLVISMLLTVVGAFLPDLFDFLPAVDEVAKLLAELGGFVLPVYYIVVKLGNAFHKLLTTFSLFGLNEVVGKQLTP